MDGKPIPTTPAPPAAPPRLALKPREAACALGLGERTLWALTASGKGPRVVRVGARVLYPVAEIEKWLAAQAEGSVTR